MAVELMKASNFAMQLKNQLLQLAIDGNKTIPTTNLTQFLEEKIPELEAAEQTEQTVAVDFRVSHYQAQLDTNLKMFESVIEYGKHAMNAAMIVNAGAAVALLTLVGNLAAHSSSGPASPFARPILYFSIGVLVAAMAIGGAYLTQYLYAGNSESRAGKGFHVTTALFVICSYALFLLGAFNAYSILGR